MRRASKGCSALYEYASLPLRIRRAWEELHGDPTKQPIKTKVIDFIHYDDKARSFYSEMVLPSGDTLTASDVQKYTLNASVLDGVREYISSKLAARSFSGRKTTKKELWSAISASIDDGEFRKAWEHTLPTFPAKLRAKYEKFIADGYASLVHLGFGNNNSRKVTQQIERLLWALYTMPNKPFGLETHDYYKMFMCGAIAVYDKQSGELFDRDAFIRQGAPMELSAATVHNYLNQARARAAVDKRRNDSLWYSDHHMPYVHRKRPQFSLSRLSADDRDLPRKDRSGVAPLAYYIYDIASTAVVGVAYSRKKDKALFLECFRDMFRTLVRKGLPHACGDRVGTSPRVGFPRRDVDDVPLRPLVPAGQRPREVRRADEPLEEDDRRTPQPPPTWGVGGHAANGTRSVRRRSTINTWRSSTIIRSSYRRIAWTSSNTTWRRTPIRKSIGA